MSVSSLGTTIITLIVWSLLVLVCLAVYLPFLFEGGSLARYRRILDMARRLVSGLALMR